MRRASHSSSGEPQAPPSDRRWLRLAVILWGIVLVGIGVRVLLWPRVHTTYPIFAAAAQDWLGGTDLYYVDQFERNGLDRYRYSPLVAVLLIPFGVLPEALGGVLWRIVNAGVFLGSLAWWLRSAAPSPLSPTQRAWFYLLVLPLAVTGLNNGQSNLLVIGLLLAGLAAVAEERWNLTAVCVGLACLLKLYPLAIGLLLVVLYPRRLAWRLALVLVLGFALPFALQRPEYVAEQYATWLRLLWADDRRGLSITRSYQDLWLLLRAWHVPLGLQGYVALQLAAALLLALWCGLGRLQQRPPRQLLVGVLTFGTCWMTLLGPATESSTYVLLAPAWAWALLEAGHTRRSAGLRGLLVLSYGLYLVAATAGWGPWRAEIRAVGVYPLSALLLFAGLLMLLSGEPKATRRPLTLFKAGV